MSKPYMRPGNVSVGSGSPTPPPNGGGPNGPKGPVSGGGGSPTPPNSNGNSNLGSSFNSGSPHAPNMNDNQGYNNFGANQPNHTPNMNDNKPWQQGGSSPVNDGNGDKPWQQDGSPNNNDGKGDKPWQQGGNSPQGGSNKPWQQDGTQGGNNQNSDNQTAGLNNGHNEPNGSQKSENMKDKLARKLINKKGGKVAKHLGDGGKGQKGKKEHNPQKFKERVQQGAQAAKGMGMGAKYIFYLKVANDLIVNGGKMLLNTLPGRALTWLHGATHGISLAAHSAISGIGSSVSSFFGGMFGGPSLLKLGIGVMLFTSIGSADLEYHALTKDGGEALCLVQKIASGGGGSGSVSGTSGAWTKKGSKAYNEAKATYAAAKAQGCDDKHAAAVTGNAAHESAMFSRGLDVHQIGGGPGVGIFQFNDPPKDMSPSGQVKAIFANAPGRKGGWEHKSGSISSLTNSFEEIFERGGIPDNGRRDNLANRAYQMFNGVGGSSADATDSAASGAGGAKCGAQGTSSGDSTDIIAYGKKFLGLGYSQGTHAQGAEDIGKGKSKSDCAKTDCSGFVWGVLKHCGYKVPSSPFVVGSGGSENRWFDSHGKCSASDTHAGSVVMADGNPHTAFLLEKWHGGSTKVLEEGGAGNNVNDDETYNYAFGSGNKPSEFANPEK